MIPSTTSVKNAYLKTILTLFISLVWLINGLFCKLLNLVPRHQLIVSHILGEEYSAIVTKTIGVLEILMFLWILSNIKPRLCALTQAVVIAAMNIIEFFKVPGLLLFGRANALLAAIFISIILLNEFILHKKSNHSNPL